MILIDRKSAYVQLRTWYMKPNPTRSYNFGILWKMLQISIFGGSNWLIGFEPRSPMESKGLLMPDPIRTGLNESCWSWQETHVEEDKKYAMAIRFKHRLLIIIYYHIFYIYCKSISRYIYGPLNVLVYNPGSFFSARSSSQRQQLESVFFGGR